MKCRKIINAVEYGSTTLVGTGGQSFPYERGNCCTLIGEDKKYYRIVNFVFENLKELVKRGLTWPIKIEVLEGCVATIADPRIPPEWYSNRFCEVCTPRNMLPYVQRIQHLLSIERGERKENENGITTFDFGRSPLFEYADKEYKEKQAKFEAKMKEWKVQIVLDDVVEVDENGKLLSPEANRKFLESQ